MLNRILWQIKQYTPPKIARRIKWFIQRGRRGWADCDTWALDGYLCSVLPQALTYLKKHKHGIPCEFVPIDSTPEEFEAAKIKWDNIMDKMILGFKAWEQILDDGYGKEELHQQWEEGSKLFIEHFGNLWD